MKETLYSLDIGDFERLLTVIQSHFELYGPTVRDSAVVYEKVETTRDLPQGWVDDQAPGRYRLEKTDSPLFFGHVVGPQSWKKYLFPAREQLWSVKKESAQVKRSANPQKPMAFLGVRSCELAAIEVQDKVFSHGTQPDAFYHRRRNDLFIVAVNCTTSSRNCFCTSMNSGPKCNGNFDLALTEVLDGAIHRIVVEVKSKRAQDLIAPLHLKTPSPAEIAAAQHAVEENAKTMARSFSTEGLKESLQNSPDHPRWNKIAERCLDCANCTMVCPTCFCSSTVDTTDLTGDNAERWRQWDSCFNLEFSYIHGGEIRKSTASRYRQWLTHKLANWWDQFGTSGCVGCGRCISWCPVGIDLTEEATAIQEGQE
ncbi:MAG: 4Fe-4S dicluster domain-containing protein [Bdellovibrionales bacterium]|nr:4Fe-4S dicluster domain-containing protein [Bdellovibrionales bacterium]